MAAVQRTTQHAMLAVHVLAHTADQLATLHRAAAAAGDKLSVTQTLVAGTRQQTPTIGGCIQTTLQFQRRVDCVVGVLPATQFTVGDVQARGQNHVDLTDAATKAAIDEVEFAHARGAEYMIVARGTPPWALGKASRWATSFDLPCVISLRRRVRGQLLTFRQDTLRHGPPGHAAVLLSEGLAQFVAHALRVGTNAPCPQPTVSTEPFLGWHAATCLLSGLASWDRVRSATGVARPLRCLGQPAVATRGTAAAATHEQQPPKRRRTEPSRSTGAAPHREGEGRSTDPPGTGPRGATLAGDDDVGPDSHLEPRLLHSVAIPPVHPPRPEGCVVVEVPERATLACGIDVHDDETNNGLPMGVLLVLYLAGRGESSMLEARKYLRTALHKTCVTSSERQLQCATWNALTRLADFMHGAKGLAQELDPPVDVLAAVRTMVTAIGYMVVHCANTGLQIAERLGTRWPPDDEWHLLLYDTEDGALPRTR
jgi:hypothetical protein